MKSDEIQARRWRRSEWVFFVYLFLSFSRFFFFVVLLFFHVFLSVYICCVVPIDFAFCVRFYLLSFFFFFFFFVFFSRSLHVGMPGWEKAPLGAANAASVGGLRQCQ